MNKKNKPLNDLSQLNLAYSTNPNQSFDQEDDEVEISPKNKQKIRVRLDTRLRAGKTVTRIDGLEESDKVLEEMCKKFKQKCGVGGSVKEGEIMIQGDHVQKIIAELISLGYKDTKRSGG
ncbi:MAG: translation initiation factor [Saprospiraceae bacterium]|jgi:translation initiation factor 1